MRPSRLECTSLAWSTISAAAIANCMNRRETFSIVSPESEGLSQSWLMPPSAMISEPTM